MRQDNGYRLTCFARYYLEIRCGIHTWTMCSLESLEEQPYNEVRYPITGLTREKDRRGGR